MKNVVRKRFPGPEQFGRPRQTLGTLATREVPDVPNVRLRISDGRRGDDRHLSEEAPTTLPAVSTRATTSWQRLTSWEPHGCSRRLITAALLGGGFVLHMARRRGVLSHPILFAEDGQVFFMGNRSEGLRVLNNAYAGYLVVGPRVGAFAASLLPLAWTPVAFALFAAAIATGSCGLALSGRTAWLLGAWPMRTLVFAALLLLPQVAETHATLTNVMWWGGVGLLLIGIADDPVSRWGCVFEALFVIAVLLSGPIGIVFAPIMLWRWWRTRSAWTGALSVIWAAACLVQIVVLRGQNRDVGKVTWSADIAAVLVRRWFGPFTIGADSVQRHLAGPAWSRLAWWATVVFVALVAVVALWARDRGAAVVLLALGTLHVVAGFVAMGPLAHLLPDRYTVGAGAAVIIAVAGARPTSRLVRCAMAVVVVWALIVWPRNVVVPQRVGPSFAPAAACISAQQPTCRVPVYPDPFSFDVNGS